ncbi:MAG: altronate dehydratase family protein [Pirellulaceae bacterium]
MQNPSIVRLHPHDNVVVAVNDLRPGEPFDIDDESVTTINRIPAGHKVAVRPIAVGDAVYKFGSRIGRATQNIGQGEHVHCHNLQHQHDVITEVATTNPPEPMPPLERTFSGYLRPNGKAGTRNYIAVISTVNCSASVSQFVARRFDAEALSDFPNVDGVFAVTHESGCGMGYATQRHEMLSRVLVGAARHPNVAACVLIGLGCEQGSLGYLVEKHGIVPLNAPDGSRLTRDHGNAMPVLTMQDEGGTRKTIERAVEIVRELLPVVNQNQRQPVSARQLVVGLECGGSDGYSGITANPAVGCAADRIVAAGGTAILSETSEIYGAEHLLVERSRDPQVALSLIERIEWWKKYVGMFGLELDNNPSVGNKAGGLTTIAEKSLGAVAKAGSTALEAVYQYAEQIRHRGLVVMDTPGYDPASVTGMVAGGANVVLFTTGRGSCFGCKPTPSIKIATNSAMYQRMIEDMDVNAGEVLEGMTVDQVGEGIFNKILAVASGEKTKSELAGIGDYEFVPWTVGPTL